MSWLPTSFTQIGFVVPEQEAFFKDCLAIVDHSERNRMSPTNVMKPLELVPCKITVVCRKCGAKRAHEVMYVNVIVRHLQCQTCRSVRVYLQATDIGDEDDKLTAIDLKTIQLQPGQKTPYPYNPKDRFAVGEFILHQTFGDGYVLALYHPPVKMAVLFADKSRLLACGSWTKHDIKCLDGTTGDPPPLEPATQPGGTSCNEPPSEIPVGNKATCPGCGRMVNPQDLRRSTDGKSTAGCTFCVLEQCDETATGR